jgi:hypothetical protein
MDILIQPLLHRARALNASVHIRYSARSQPLGESTDSFSSHSLAEPREGSAGMTSYVIIRRQYSYLEPVIRSMFEDAQDVMVFIDRRSEEGGGTSEVPGDGERRTVLERRSSTPMLDILINVPS